MPDQGARPEPDPDTRSASADVAVVIVNFNSGGDVSRAVRSVLDAAGDARVEIVVVDNHSRDGSADRAEADFPGLRVVRNERNVGFPSAANVGMRVTRAPWVFLLNPDARVTGGTLGGVLKLTGDRPEAGVIGVLTRNGDGTVYPSARKVPTYP